MNSINLSDRNLTEDDLIKLYNQYTTYEISNLLKVSRSCVRRWLKLCNIKRRKKGERSLNTKIEVSVLKIKNELDKFDRKSQIKIFNQVRNSIIGEKK